MKNLSAFSSFFVFISVSAVSVNSQTAEIIRRPAYADISAAESRSAVLIRLSGYASNEARYRLFNGSYQYNCWNTAAGSYVTSTAYANGPLVTGEPVSSTTFWIPYLRGNNISVSASYRDRLGPDYSTNYQTAALPVATEITSSFILSGTLTEGEGFPLSLKYVLLAWSGSALISASHSDPGTGSFSVVCPAGITIDRLEVKTVGDEQAGVKNGSWNSDSNIGTVTLAGTVKVNSEYALLVKIYPVPAVDILHIEGQGVSGVIELFDPAGRTVLSATSTGEYRQSIDISDLHPGIYFIKISVRGRIAVKKLVKN